MFETKQRNISSTHLKNVRACKEECIMIGDNLDADIQGAINAGIDTIFVNHLNIEATHSTNLHDSSFKRIGRNILILNQTAFATIVHRCVTHLYTLFFTQHLSKCVK